MKTKTTTLWKGFLFLLINSFVFSVALAQVSPYSLSNQWRFGEGSGLNFPNGNFPMSGNPISTPAASNPGADDVEASTAISDRAGVVAVYTNTMIVRNVANTNIRNLLTPDNTCAGSSTGGGTMVPDPASPDDTYYLFTANDITLGGCQERGINYYRFRKNGAGQAVYLSGGPPQAPLASGTMDESITAGNDGQGNYWLVARESGSSTFRVWRIHAGGITALAPQVKTPSVSVNTTQSYLKISPCQDKIAWHGGTNLVVYEFDRTNGTIGNLLYRAWTVGHGVGLEFSPNGNIVYVSGQGNQVQWYDITTGWIWTGAAPFTPPAGTSGLVPGSGSWSMQMGPDGRIYTSPGGTTVGIIQNPNNTATGYSTMTVTSPGTFNGLINIAWLSPQTPIINPPTIDDCEVEFSHTFRNYFNTAVGIDATTVRWDFNNDGSTDAVADGNLNPTYTYSGPGGSKTVRLYFQDAFCHHNWQAQVTFSVSCPMPVDWLDIDAAYNNGAVEVTWSTAMEIDNDYFEVQRSIDGINFVTIGTANSKGNSNRIQEYSFTDLSPIAGGSYYRIVQHDIDGKFTNSPNAFVNINSVIVNVSPNPSSSDFDLTISGTSSALVIVTDVLGRVVYQKTLSGNIITETFGADLTEGAYSLQVIADGYSYTEKIVKK